jgi:hypothetical protein
MAGNRLNPGLPGIDCIDASVDQYEVSGHSNSFYLYPQIWQISPIQKQTLIQFTGNHVKQPPASCHLQHATRYPPSAPDSAA